MEVHPGVFVSNIATDDWEPDPEVGGEVHVLVEGDDAFAGMSRFRGASEVGPWIAPVRETILVLEGAARIEIGGGPTLEVGVGDMASLPQGAAITWHMTGPYKELWFFAHAYDVASE